jgi:hypothetical protein
VRFINSSDSQPLSVGATPPEVRCAPTRKRYAPHVPSGSATATQEFPRQRQIDPMMASRVRVGTRLQQLAWCLAEGPRHVPAPRSTDGERLELVKSSPATPVTARLDIAAFGSICKKAFQHASPWQTTAAKGMVLAFQYIMKRGSIDHGRWTNFFHAASRLFALTVPRPLAKFQPGCAANAAVVLLYVDVLVEVSPTRAGP